MSEPLDADQVARHEFSLGFRGFDQNEVRAFLGRVAAELAVAGEREARLREQVAQLEAAPAPELDEAALEAALGHEATKVIHAARGAAAEIRANAEQSGEALRAEVDAAIAALRSDTERRAAGILEESRAKAAAMLIDANAERARVLDDTRAQRDAMRAELDALRAARARLTGAYDSVRRALDTTARDVADADAAAGAVVAAQPVTDLAPEAGPSEEAEAVVETIDWSGAGGESEPEPELDVPEPEPEPEAE
ncbi:MAG: hypothetical protein QOI47_2107, partial [Actinomycetota bacterium]|nr:hypothetical protein [Actinomycetota bacterium]